MGTYRRIVHIPESKLSEFNEIARSKGWTVEDSKRSEKFLRDMPRREYSNVEMDSINKEIVAEIKAYRHGC